MRILITSGLGISDIGGTAQYGFNLASEFSKLEHQVTLRVFGKLEKLLPSWLRHLYFLVKIFPDVARSDVVLALDVYSTGVPTAIASCIMRKKFIVRVGGDFLWESYVNRTSDPITLPKFYEERPSLNFKEKIISFFLNFALIKISDTLVFNTEWQRKIWASGYGISDKKTAVVRNYIPAKAEGIWPTSRVFLWAGRESKVKNIEMLRPVSDRVRNSHPEFSLELLTNISHKDLLEKVKGCYAVVMPSLSDVCPNFILEAASFNKPFIMTKETGLDEIYPTGGVFIDPKDEKEWGRHIEAMLDYRVYNKYAGELVKSKEEHSWSDLANEFIAIWKKN